MSPRLAVRRLGPAAVALLALATTACSGPATAPPAGPPTEPPPASTAPPTPGTTPTSPRPTNDPEAAVRTRLADALRADDPASANQVAAATTRLAVLDTGWLPGWLVVDVNVRSMPHPRRFYVGLSEDGRARYLSGKPAGFDAMVTDARIRVGEARTAVAVGETFLDVTRGFQRYSTRVQSLDDVSWRPDLSPAEEATREEVLATYGGQVKPPRATPAGDGWTLTAWMVDGTTLVRHDLTVAAAGTVTDRSEVVVADLPVPVSV